MTNLLEKISEFAAPNFVSSEWWYSEEVSESAWYSKAEVNYVLDNVWKSWFAEALKKSWLAR